MAFPAYETLHLEYASEHVLEVRLNRPKKRNAMNTLLWTEIGHCFGEWISREPRVRCVLLTGAGPTFSAGIDLVANAGDGGNESSDGADSKDEAFYVLRHGGAWQRAWLSLNRCPVPVIACAHGGCFGAALEMCCFADVRWASAGTVFQAPEVTLGIAADVGGNQAFPKLVGNDSMVRELMMSGRRFDAAEAMRLGLVSRVVEGGREALVAQAAALAEQIAAKSPIAMVGVKKMLNFSRDHSLDESLEYGLTWNAGMLRTSDIREAGVAFMMKQTPRFRDAPPLVMPKPKL
jgi:enoyl-CoA hydratase/carnithine racemase